MDIVEVTNLLIVFKKKKRITPRQILDCLNYKNSLAYEKLTISRLREDFCQLFPTHGNIKSKKKYFKVRIKYINRFFQLNHIRETRVEILKFYGLGQN